MQIRLYVFDGPAPMNISRISPNSFITYDESGRITSSAQGAWLDCYRYDSKGKLVRKTQDYQDWQREIWTYTYDPEGELLHLHSEKRERGPHYLEKWDKYTIFDPEFYARADDDQFEPTGEYTDEWFSWEEEGRIRRRDLSIHAKDGNDKGVMMEVYDEGMLQECWIGEDRENTPHREIFSYRKEGTLKLTQAINRLEDESGDTMLHTTTVEYDEHEQPVKCICDGSLKYEVKYEYDDNGNWTRATHKDGLGFITQEIIRTINYR